MVEESVYGATCIRSLFIGSLLAIVPTNMVICFNTMSHVNPIYLTIPHNMQSEEVSEEEVLDLEVSDTEELGGRWQPVIGSLVTVGLGSGYRYSMIQGEGGPGLSPSDESGKPTRTWCFLLMCFVNS